MIKIKNKFNLIEYVFIFNIQMVIFNCIRRIQISNLPHNGVHLNRNMLNFIIIIN